MSRLRFQVSPLVVPLVVLGAIFAGCGEEAEQLTAAQLISRGDELCREGQARFEEIQSQPPANATEAAGQTDELIEVATDELNELRNLRPPDDLRESYDAYLEVRGTALERLRDGRDAADEQDAEGYAEAQAEVTADSGQRQKLATAVGFRVCSKPSS